MSRLSFNDVAILKSQGRHFQAGALDAVLGGQGHYGAHYGMRSTRESARSEYAFGHWVAAEYLRRGDLGDVMAQFSYGPDAPSNVAVCDVVDFVGVCSETGRPE